MQFFIKIATIFIAMRIAATIAWHDFGDGYAASSQFLQNFDQFFEQDTSGLYAYGYRSPQATKQEVRTEDGVTRGFYSYVDANGELQTVRYVADAGGFRVAATNLPHAPTHAALPQPVTETPEVAAARAQHLAAHEAIKLRNSLSQFGSRGLFNDFLRSKFLLSESGTFAPVQWHSFDHQFIEKTAAPILKEADFDRRHLKTAKKALA